MTHITASRLLVVGMILSAITVGCDSTSEPVSEYHRYEMTETAWSRIDRGEIPVLVLQAGLPCPGAAVGFESYYTEDGTHSLRGVIEEGETHHVPTPLDTEAMLTGEDGMAWWLPEPAVYAWWLTAAHEERGSVTVVTLSRCEELRMAARAGIVELVVEIPAPQEWFVEIDAPESVDAREIPVHFTDQEGVIEFRLRSTALGQYSSYALNWETLRFVGDGTDSFRLVAGFDVENALEVRPDNAAGLFHFDLSRTGSIEVELLDLSGAPELQQRAVYLTDAANRENVRWSAAHSPAAPSARSKDGRAILHGVPLGRRWILGAFLLPSGTLVAKVIEGPKRAGEVVPVVLSAVDETVNIEWQILMPDGTPASHRMARLEADASASVMLRTDDEGRCTFVLPRLWLETSREWILRSWDSDLVPTMRVELEANSILLGSEELSVTWHPEAQPFATGYVLDEADLPVARAAVSTELYQPETKTTRLGSFTLSSDEREDLATIDIFIDSPWHLQSSTTLERGNLGKLIRVETGARLCGRAEYRFEMFEAPDWKSNSSRNPSTEWTYGLHDWGSRDGDFEIGPIPVDATEITMTFGDAGTTVLRNLKLEAGKVYRYPELVRPQK